MKFKDFMSDLFSKASNTPQFRPLPSGRPRNVGHNGSIARHPGVIVASHYKRHVTKEGKACSQNVKGNKRPPIPTMLHRAVPVSVFKAKKNAIARKAMGRYVW